MKPKIVERQAFHVVGMRERFVPGKIEGIPLLWERFIEREREIADVVHGASYGVSENDSSAGRPGFFYTAGLGAKSLDRIPEGMTGLTIPAGTYAVFTHHGPLRDFKKTFAAIWEEWLPTSGMRHTGGPVVELYDARYKVQSPDSEIDVYLPIVADPGR